MKMLKIIFIFICIISSSVQGLKCPPNSVIQNDSPWVVDYPNTSENLYGYIFRQKMGNNQYDDAWKGISYTPAKDSMCYRVTPLKKLNSSPISSGDININKDQTNIYNLYNDICCKGEKECYIPAEFDANDRGTEYYLIFDVVNPTKNNADFQFFAHQNCFIDPINYPLAVQKFELTSKMIAPANSVTRVTIPIIIEPDYYDTFQKRTWGAQITVNGVTSNVPFYYDGNGLWPSNALQTNLEIIFANSINGALGIATFSIMHRLKNTAELDYSGGVKCKSDSTCVENASCNGVNCVKCADPGCEKCENGINSKNTCTKCPPTSTTWNKLSQSPGPCIIDYLDITKFSDDIKKTSPGKDQHGEPRTQVPPAIHWRVTLEFWTYINYPKEIIGKLLNLIYKDFMTITMTSYNDDDLTVVCTPIEWLYTIEGADPAKSLNDILDTDLGAFYVEDKVLQTGSKWFYTRCGFNIDTNKMYLNDGVETNLKIPQMFNGYNNFPFQMKKFYKPDQYVDFIFENFSGISTYIYLRNINIYREYIPQNIITKYFNMHKLTLHSEFPQLLYSIPFDEVIPQGNGKYKFKTYNYYKRYNNGAMGIYDNVIIFDDNELTILPGVTLMPPRNFYRLNLLDINIQASDCEYLKTEPIPCDNGQHFDKCFDENKPFVCTESKTKPYYLDIQTLTCNQKCPEGWYHPPDDTTYQFRDYCSAQCDASTQVCPWAEEHYTTITSFSCPNGFFDLYYKCYRTDELLVDSNAMLFSSTLNSHTIYIDLGKSYDTYVLEFWFYFDLRFPRLDEKEEKVKNSVIFMTNSIKVIYGDSTRSFPYYNIITDGTTLTTSDRPSKNGWNHFIFSYDELIDKNHEYYASFGHNLYDYYFGRRNANNLQLKYIVFCNDDWDIATVNKKCQNIYWVDGYYRNIKVWDVTYSTRYAVFYSYQFEGINNIMIKHIYSLKLDKINKNILVDSVGGRNGELDIMTGNAKENPDYESFITYESNFSYEELIPGYINSFNVQQNLVNVVSSPCSIGCKLCYGPSNSNCLSCKEGYSLFNYHCYLDINDANTRGYYTYRNPALNMPKKLSLNIHKDVVDKWEFITIFFFIKIYGFVNRVGETQILIYLNEADNFYLGYDPNPDLESLCFYYYNKEGQTYFVEKMFELTPYRELYFGHWVPVSISLFRESERPYRINMVQAAMQYSNLPFLPTTHRNNEFPYLSFTEFSITNTWIGLLADVQIFNHFIVDPWGLIKSKDIVSESGQFLQYRIDMKSTDKDSDCLSKSNIITTTDQGFKVVCVHDYNPHWYQCGNPNNANYLSWSQGEAVRKNGIVCENAKCMCHGSCGGGERCLGNLSPNLDYQNLSCENCHRDWFQWYIVKQNNRILCRYLKYLDYARYKNARAIDIDSPLVVFSIDFWFYTQTVHNWNNANKRMNNFDSFEIEWDYHMRIRIENIKTNPNDLLDNQYKYYAKCTPQTISGLSNRDPVTNTIDLGNRHGRWSYIACGVNASTKNFYITNKNRVQNIISYSSTNTIPLEKVTLTLKENSRNAYGVTFIHELRLWQCYDCSPAFRNFGYDEKNFNFNAVLHDFIGEAGSDVEGTPGDGNYKDRVTKTIIFLNTEVADFKGYTILDPIGSYITCNETKYEYYNEDNGEDGQCITQYNIARFNDFQFTIPSSRTGRYTMELWFYIEDSLQISQGINIIWEKHMSISLIRDPTQTGTIVGVCFPQAYRDKVNGLRGTEIFNLYDQALNKEKYNFHSGSSQWLFVRCAIDQSRKLYYMDTTNEKELLSETIYGSVTNYRPFRYYDINPTSILLFEHAKEIKTRIFLRSFRAYREYIDPRIDNIKFFDLSGYNTNSFWPLILYIDFIKFEYGNNYGLVYQIYDETGSIGTGTYYLGSFRNGDTDPYYSTYPDLHNLILCNPGQTGGGTNTCSGNQCRYCMDSSANTYFYPPQNGYIDMNTLKFVQNCAGHTRLPDSNRYKAYCLRDCSKDNIDTCAETSGQMSNINTYSNEYRCKTGYTRVYYECIKDELVKDSAMYFSNYFSFNNLVVTTKTKNQEIKSYYLEVWLKFDYINYNEKITEQEVYLLAPPHLIIQDENDQLYKYANTQISSGTYFYELASITTYEWNRIIIENSHDPDTNLYTIKVFVNYDFDNPDVIISNLDATLYDMALEGIGFCNQPSADCLINNVVYNKRWGVAWYRNIRVWDASTSSLELIQACEVGYTQLLKSQLYYFQFTIDSINGHHIEDRTDKNMKYLSNKFWYDNPRNDYDNEMRENYSVNTFDYSYLNPGHFVSGLNDGKTDYQLGACANACKRCYSAASNNCYECQQGYALYGKTCKTVTGYYLKTPANNNAVNSLKLVTQMLDPAFDIKTQSPLTITIWMKFFGITLEAQDKEFYPIIYFYGTDSFFGYDNKNGAFVIRLKDVDGNQGTMTAFSSPIKDYVGQWTHFGFSIHRSTAAQLPAFPHMFNFMINHKVLPPEPGFNPQKIGVYLDNISFNMEPIAFFSNIKFYSTFWFGTYGHINALSSTRNTDLIFEYKLYGSAGDNCISDSEIDGITTGLLQPVCISDYLPYDDVLNQCTSDSTFIDLNFPLSPPCDACSSTCITQCYDTSEKSCSSDYYQGLYWIATQDPIDHYYSQKIDSINFAFYEKATVTGLNMVKNDEISLEFWAYIYEYNQGAFESVDIIWDKHVRVQIEKAGGGAVNAKCFPYTNINNLNIGAGTFIQETFNLGEWYYIRCMADRYYLKYKMNEDANASSYTLPENINQDTSSLTIVDNTALFNYGFSFIRELKLFSSYNYGFWKDSGHNLSPENFQYLLHYYKNTFDGTDIKAATMIDQVTQFIYKLTLKPDRIGYNYVIGYKYLELCNEGYCYKAASQKCEIFNTGDCTIARNEDGKCLKCASSKPYLKNDDSCYKQCEPYYYNDDYLMQCRSCDQTCLTCSGKLVNNCLSCEAPRYLVKEKHICTLNCVEYDLTPDPHEQVCGPFQAKANITNYDITKPIDLKGFNELIALVYDASLQGYTLEWSFNRMESVNENVNYRDFKDTDIPLTSPFVGPLTNINVNLDNSFFKNGLKYVFYLDIIQEQLNFSTKVSIKFIITINDKPIAGILNTLPNAGYISTNYLFTCNECSDDNTEKQDLLYKFSYFPDPNDLTNEIVLQDYSRNSEILKTFDSLPTVNDEYLIKCYCMDGMNEFGTSTASIKCYAPPNDSGVNVPISDSISSIDTDQILSPEQLSNRAEFLSTITVDYPKEQIVNRTNITRDEQLLILEDPNNAFRDEYCNKRGESYVIDKYLTCDCSNYYGEICQIDGNSYNSIISLYKQLYTKIIEAQTTSFNWYLLNGVQKLIRSGSMFLPIEQMDFMVQSIEYTTLNMQNFGTDIMQNNNYEKLFDIYNSLLEYGMFMVNNLKKKNYIEKNSKLPTGVYNGTLIRNATLTKEQTEVMKVYFSRIKDGLNSIMKFFADKKFEFTFRNKNLNVYVALLNENFSFKTYFSMEESLYESYFDVSNCISNVMKSTTSSASYKIFMTAIIWKISPYIYQDQLYLNNTTPVVSIEFIDYYTLKRVYLTDCGVSNEIEIYFPVTHYLMAPRINDKRDFVSPENQFESTSDIFNDPVYIDPKGQVFNSTPQERIDMYFVPFNFTCKYFDESSSSFLTDGVDYSNFTNNDYIQCKSLHLTDFVIEHFDVHGDFHVNTRFFYLKHYMLFAFWENYKFNPVVLFVLILIPLYFAIILLYLLFEFYFNRQADLLSYLKRSIVKINLPYRDRYDFNENLNLSPEIQQKLYSDKKRNPDLYEKNMDINNVDVMLMADQLVKYGKPYKEINNEIGNQNDFFGTKMTEKGTEANTQANFFRANTDGREEDEVDESKSGDILKLDREDPKKKMKRLNKFFQVGFTGTDANERINKNLKNTENNEFIIEDLENEDEQNQGYLPNPPMKSQGKKVNNLFETKKIANSKMKFFEKEGRKHKRQVNPFQEDYDHYIPKFEKPKVVSTTLDFFEKEKQTEKKTYLDDFRKDRNLRSSGTLGDQDAEAKILQTQHKTEIDFEAEKYKENLPDLTINLTLEKKLLELSKLNLDCIGFFKKNLSNRYILLTTFARFSICYSRYKRIGNFICQLFLYMFFLSIFYTADSKMEIMNKKDGPEIGLFIAYCLCSMIGADLLIHLPSYMFYIDVRNFRKVYHTIKENRGLEIFKHYDQVANHRFWWNFLGVLIHWLFIILSIYFAFGFCATYYYQRTTFFIGFIVTFLSDIIIFEVLWELVIAFFYAIRHKGRCCIRICELLNYMRNVKSLT